MDRFTVTTALSGFEVEDEDGRIVSDVYSTFGKAQDVADRMNEAVETDGQSLAHLFGCSDDGVYLDELEVLSSDW